MNSKGKPRTTKKTARKSADCKRGRRKGATSKNVKNRQKVSKSFSTLFDNFRAGQKTSKIVKKCQKHFRHFSTIFARPLFSGPFCNPLRKVPINVKKPCSAVWKFFTALLQNVSKLQPPPFPNFRSFCTRPVPFYTPPTPRRVFSGVGGRISRPISTTKRNLFFSQLRICRHRHAKRVLLTESGQGIQ